MFTGGYHIGRHLQKGPPHIGVRYGMFCHVPIDEAFYKYSTVHAGGASETMDSCMLARCP